MASKKKKPDQAPRPSQAEGEEQGSNQRPAGADRQMNEPLRPSQAEGGEEEVEESLRQQKQQGRH
jgi:hypothetical protein